MSVAARPLSLEQQADFIDGLITRCTMRDGATAAETHMTVTAADAGHLLALASRLRCMAPHENAIREMVLR